MEADANRLIGMQWTRRLTRHAESHAALSQEQWGNRPGRSAIDAAILKTCTYHFFHLKHTSGGSFDNDATACYDRLVISLPIPVADNLDSPKKLPSYWMTFSQKRSFTFARRSHNRQTHAARTSPFIYTVLGRVPSLDHQFGS